MSSGVNTVLYPVKDLAQAKTLFGALLGAAPIADAPYYVGFRVAGQDIGLVPYGQSKWMTGPVGYYEVTDIKASIAQLVALGAELLQDAMDVGGGKLVAAVRDQDGNVIGLSQSPAAS